MMLLTVTPNPTIDRTLYLPQMTIGQVHRATKVHLAAGGKGLNVSRAAHTLGCEVLTTGPLAGRAGQIVAELAKVEDLSADWHWLQTRETRTCLLINHETGDATVINEPGPTLSAKEWSGFAAHIKQLAQKVQAVTFAGSVPPGVAPAALGALARSLISVERAVYVDTSGTALAAVLTQPDGLRIKVNQFELATGLNIELGSDPIERLVEAGQLLLARGAVLVVITLGSEGALAIAPEGAWQASSAPIAVSSTVGSGDSMLAGLAVARLKGQLIDTALAFGVACGSANALSDLPGHFKPRQVKILLAKTKIKRVD
jgi:1-phosphofructokinase family hexose kinase